MLDCIFRVFKGLSSVRTNGWNHVVMVFVAVSYIGVLFSLS